MRQLLIQSTKLIIDKASSLTVKEILPRDVPIVRVGRGLLSNAELDTDLPHRNLALSLTVCESYIRMCLHAAVAWISSRVAGPSCSPRTYSVATSALTNASWQTQICEGLLGGFVQAEADSSLASLSKRKTFGCTSPPVSCPRP